MKILFCVEFYFPSMGGAQEVVRQIAERMVEFGHDVSIATSQIKSRTTLELNGVQIEEFDVAGNFVRGFRGEVNKYRDFLVKSKFDLVFFYAAQQWTFDAAWQVIDSIPGKTVLVPCGYSGLYLPAYKTYFDELPNILRKIDGIVYHSKNYRDFEFANKNKIANGILIPNGADEKEFLVTKDLEFRKEHGIDVDAIVLLTVGTFTGLKGHLELAEAFKQATFNGRNAILLLNGNTTPMGSNVTKLLYLPLILKEYGLFKTTKLVLKSLLWALGINISKTRPLKERIKKINKQLTKEKRIVILDLPRPQLVQAYLNADLFVFASNVEYSPLVLFEACAAGLPFLSVPVGNSEEIADWTKSGEICLADVDAQGYTRVNADKLAQKIEDLISNKAKLQELGRNGRLAWQIRYNWDSLAREYESFFIELIDASTML